MRKVLTILVSVSTTLLIVLGGVWYYKTLPERRYNKQTEQLRRVVDRQELELKAYQYTQAINKIKAAAQKAAQKKPVKEPTPPPGWSVEQLSPENDPNQ